MIASNLSIVFCKDSLIHLSSNKVVTSSNEGNLYSSGKKVAKCRPTCSRPHQCGTAVMFKTFWRAGVRSCHPGLSSLSSWPFSFCAKDSSLLLILYIVRLAVASSPHCRHPFICMCSLCPYISVLLGYSRLWRRVFDLCSLRASWSLRGVHDFSIDCLIVTAGLSADKHLYQSLCLKTPPVRLFLKYRFLFLQWPSRRHGI